MRFFSGVGNGMSRGITRGSALTNGLFRRVGQFTRGVEKEASAAVDKTGKWLNEAERKTERVASGIDNAYGKFMDTTSKVVSAAEPAVKAIGSAVEKVAPEATPYVEAAKESTAVASKYRDLRSGGRGAISSLFGAFSGSKLTNPTETAGRDVDKDLEPATFKEK